MLIDFQLSNSANYVHNFWTLPSTTCFATIQGKKANHPTTRIRNSSSSSALTVTTAINMNHIWYSSNWIAWRSQQKSTAEAFYCPVLSSLISSLQKNVFFTPVITCEHSSLHRIDHSGFCKWKNMRRNQMLCEKSFWLIVSSWEDSWCRANDKLLTHIITHRIHCAAHCTWKYKYTYKYIARIPDDVHCRSILWDHFDCFSRPGSSRPTLGQQQSCKMSHIYISV